MFTHLSGISLNSRNILEIFKNLSLKDWLLLGFCVSGLLSVIFGAVLLLKDRQNAFALENSISDVSSSREELFIDVSGAVKNPGIYQVPSTARVATVLDAAGGLDELADPTFVSESLNLAKSLSDEEKIFIPFKKASQEILESDTSDKIMTQNYPENSPVIDTLISINLATEEALMELPRIGEVTAQKIIAGRPYQTKDELITKKIVSQSVFEEISQLIKL